MNLGHRWRSLRKSMRFRLVLLIVASVLPVGIAASILVYTHYQQEREDISQSMLETTRRYSATMDQELEGILATLQTLAKSPALSSGNLTCLYDQTLLALVGRPGADIILADETGQQLANSYLPHGAPLPKRNIPDRVKRLFETGEPSVSDIFKGAVTGRHLVGFDVPVMKEGRAIYDLGMTLPVDTLLQNLLLPKLPPEWTATILDSNGVVATRTRDHEKFAGTTPHMPVLARHKETAREGVFEAQGLAGVPVLVGYSQSTISGWTMVISVPMASVEKHLWPWLLWGLGGTFLLGCIGVGIALRLGNSISQSINSLADAAMAVGMGKPVANGHYDFSETKGVGESLARASELLQQRDNALRESQFLLHTALASMSDAMFISDVDGNFLVSSDAFASFYRFNDRQKCFKNLAEFPNVLEVFTENGDLAPLEQWAVPRALRGETGKDVIYNLRRRDTGERWVGSYSFAPLYDTNGKIVGSVVVGRDITKRKQAEQALKENEERLELALAATNIVLWDWSLNTGDIFLSPQAFRMLGYEPGEFTPSFDTWREQVHPDDLPRVLRNFEEAMKNCDSRFNEEFRMKTKQGHYLWIAQKSQLMDFDENNKATRIIGTYADFTGRKRAEQFRIDVERIIRHDIKAPLAGIHSLAQYALSEDLDGELRAEIPPLLHGIRQVINLIDSSDKVAQMELGEYKPQSKWFDIKGVVQSIELSLRTWITTKRIRLVQQGALDPVARQLSLVFGEEFLIENMLLNLVKNAVEASPGDNDVTISLSHENDEQRIDIHNMGTIPETIRDRFFEKYATEGKSHGKGLGTYSAQLIAKAHGGGIEFTTSGTDGTTVSVILPFPQDERR
ncbi:PAS domain-containing protein [Fundidesulfovibrio putealis]|uniref:PAS domain-containing protein n=1 Tax=Fundidesulfovibrio putealis TaxID=270496 RepID=UPI0004081697|nr:PAS domain-containing protein [Fundidesulfovibrio putealis]